MNYENQRVPEQRYTPLPQDSRVFDNPLQRKTSDHRQGLDHVKQLSQYGVLFAVLVLVFGMSFYLYSTQFALRSQADTELGPQMIAPVELLVTDAIVEYPVSYDGVLIPETFITEARILYNELPEPEQRTYIINRIALYYILYEELYGEVILPENFRELEKRVPELITEAEAAGINWQVLVQERVDKFE